MQKAESDDVLMHKKEAQTPVLEPEPEDFVFPASRIPRVKPAVNPRHGEENLDESRDEFNAFDLSQELMKFDKPLEIETSQRDLGEIDHEELQYIVEKLHRFARWQRQKLAKKAGIVSQSFSTQLDIIINNSIRVIIQKTPRALDSSPFTSFPKVQFEPENLDENAQDVDDMLDKIDTQLQQRRQSMTARSRGAASGSQLASSAGLSSDRRFSAVDQFRYSKQVLARMSIKELGILLSCLMPIVQVEEARYMIGAAIKEIIVKKDRILIKGSTGFEELNTFIARYALSECLVIWRVMQQQGLSYRDTVVNLLQLKGANSKLTAKYKKECSDDVSELFEVIASLIKQKQRDEYSTGSKNYFRNMTPTKSAFQSKSSLNQSWSNATPTSAMFKNANHIPATYRQDEKGESPEVRRFSMVKRK